MTGIDAGRQVERESPAEERERARPEGPRRSSCSPKSCEAPAAARSGGAPRSAATAPARAAPRRPRAAAGPAAAAAAAARNGTEAGARHWRVAAGLELDRPGDLGGAGAAPRQRDLDRERVPRRRRAASRRTRTSSTCPRGYFGSPACTPAGGIERDRRRDQVVLGGRVAVDVAARGERRVEDERALPGARVRAVEARRRVAGAGAPADAPRRGARRQRRRGACESASHGFGMPVLSFARSRAPARGTANWGGPSRTSEERERLLGLVLGERDLRAEELGALSPVGVLRRLDQPVDRLRASRRCRPRRARRPRGSPAPRRASPGVASGAATARFSRGAAPSGSRALVELAAGLQRLAGRSFAMSCASTFRANAR